MKANNDYPLLLELLQAGLYHLQLDLSATIQDQLLSYVYLLEKWNHVYNLTAIRELTSMIPTHLLDSLSVVSHLQGHQLLDVGTGGGLPGMVLAMACPQQHWTLLDKSAKKIRFIQQAIVELNLTNVNAVCTTIEHFETKTLFDTIIARAYTRLFHFYQQTIPLCHTNGCLLAMKGTEPFEELAEMQKYSVTIKCIPLQVPQLQAQRHLVIIKKFRSA